MYLHLQKFFFLYSSAHNSPRALHFLTFEDCFVICVLLIVSSSPPLVLLTVFHMHLLFLFFSIFFFITFFLFRMLLPPISAIQPILQGPFQRWLFIFLKSHTATQFPFQTFGSNGFLNSESFGVYTENMYTFHLLRNIPSGALSVP